MKLKEIAICGHFSLKRKLLNGQTVKTKVIAQELENCFGSNHIITIDTHGGIRKFPFFLFNSFRVFIMCKNIIIMPAQNGLRVIVPIYVFLNSIFHRKLHYIVIGGWLNDFLETHKLLTKKLKKFKHIYVETLYMKNALEKRMLNNISVMPNFKRLEILQYEDLIHNEKVPYKLCTFSRILKEKGIEDAINAVISINEKENRCIYILDLYGQIDIQYKESFERILEQSPDYINYNGIVPYNESNQILKEYNALLFPTYYKGEGFAGTLIDAFAAGIPVIASNWKYNNEIVIDQYNGFIFKSVSELEEILGDYEKNMAICDEMKMNCISTARAYAPEIVMQELIYNIKY